MAQLKTTRKERIPFGAPRTKLNVPERLGYVRRWINDVGGRVTQALEGGYKFVEDSTITVGETLDGNEDIGSRVSKIVGTSESGQPLRAYLMEIKKQWYDEDQELKNSQIDEVENSIRKGSQQTDEARNMYVPQGGISIRRE